MKFIFYIPVLLMLTLQSFASDQSIMPEGSGTKDNPYLISKIENFVWLAEQRNVISPFRIVYCKQINDIYATETKDWKSKYYDEDNLAYSNTWVRGFPQISTNNKESGQIGNSYWILNYDGQNFSIIDPFINSYDAYYGPYQGIFSDGIFQLSNIVINNIEVRNGESANTGLLVGFLVSNEDTPSFINNCHVNGKVSDKESLMSGVIGWAYIGKETSISVCNSSFDLEMGGNSLIGGVLARVNNYGNLNIEKVGCNSRINCADGQVERAAGFVANLMTYFGSNTTIADSFAITEIDCGKKIGWQTTRGAAGFIGCISNQDGYDSAVKISNCYSSGTIIGESVAAFTKSFVGECGGYNSNEVIITSCYYNSNSFIIEDLFAHGKTEAEMKISDTFVGWDFENIWDIDERESFPYLRTVLPEPCFCVWLAFLVSFGLRFNKRYL